MYKMKKSYGVLFSLMLTLALFVSACGNDEADTVDEPVAGEEVIADDAEVAADAEAEADADAEAEIDEAEIDEADVVATAVVTETLTDTDVMTETIVTTETESAEVVAETIVMTDTDVTIDTDTETVTDTEVETTDVSTEGTMAVMVLTDADGNEFLGDPVEQVPFFASEQEGAIDDDRFAPVEFGEEVLYDENLDTAMFGEMDQDGMRQLTYNGYALYHFTGEEGGDWMTAAQEAGLSPLTPDGEFWSISE